MAMLGPARPAVGPAAAGEQVTPAARRLYVRWGRRRKERGTSGMAGWWLEARERASASRPWEHSSAAMAVHAPSTKNREGVGRQVRASGQLGIFRSRAWARWRSCEQARGPRGSSVLRSVCHEREQALPNQYHCEITTETLTLPSSISRSSGHLITAQEAKL